MTTLQVLRKARGLVERGWCQKTTATDKSGRGVSATSRKAASFCVVGAMIRVEGFQRNDGTEILKRLCADDLSGWNDAPGRKKADVLRLFDQAIKAVQR